MLRLAVSYLGKDIANTYCILVPACKTEPPHMHDYLDLRGLYW